MNALPEDLVSVLVPREHVLDVYAYIAQLTDRGVAASNGAKAPSPAEWEPELLRRMFVESPPAMQDILNALAARPNEWLTAVDLAKSIRHKPDADANTVAGTLGAFRRRCRNRYGRADWPFSSQWDHVRSRFLYSMTSEVAAEVRSAASA